MTTQQRLTTNGLDRALDFLAGVRPAQEQTTEMVKAWRVKLARYTDDQLMRALWELSERDDLIRIDVGDVYVAAQRIANRQELDRRAVENDRQRRALPEGNVLVTDGHCEQARAHLARYGFASHGPMLEGLARHLARGGTLDTPDHTHQPLPRGARGWCAKCNSALLGYDPPGDTCRNCDPDYLRTYGTRNR